MKKKIVGGIALGAFTYLLVLAANCPAAWIWAHINSRTPGVQLGGINGSLWSGSTQARISGMNFGKLQWHVTPISMLNGGLGFKIIASGSPSITVRAHVTLGYTGKLTVTDLRGSLPAKSLEELLPLLPEHSIVGTLNLQLHRLVVENGRPTACDGTVTFGNATLLWPRELLLGDYRIKFSTVKTGIDGIARDESGPLRLNARLLLSKSGNYNIHGTLAARDSRNKQLSKLLGYLGGEDAAGNHQFTLTGNLQ